MAVDFDVADGKRTSEYGFFPEDIEVTPELNGRHDLPDIQWIVDSILKHGQLQPVTIRRTQNKPVLVAGFSRWRAVTEINKKGLAEKPLRLRCSYTQLTEKQAFLANIEENRVRNQTTPMDDAYNIQRLINVYQMTEEEAADAFRASVSWVKGRLTLLELTADAEKEVRSGRVAPSAAIHIAKLTKEQQKKVIEKNGKITAATVREVVPPTPKPSKVNGSQDGPLEAAQALVKSISKAEIKDLRDAEHEWFSVSRVKLLALYDAIGAGA